MQDFRNRYPQNKDGQDDIKKNLFGSCFHQVPTTGTEHEI